MRQTAIITTKRSNPNILNDITATGSFLFNYLLLFQLCQHLVRIFKNAILSLHLFEKVDRFANHGFSIFPCDRQVYRKMSYYRHPSRSQANRALLINLIKALESNESKCSSFPLTNFVRTLGTRYKATYAYQSTR